MMFQWWLSEGEEITWCWWHHYNTILGIKVVTSDQRLITFHIVQPLMPCWSALWVYVLSIWVCLSRCLWHICIVCCVHTCVLTLLLLHVLVLWTYIPSIVCYCVSYCVLSCMSVIGAYMQCSSHTDSVLHRKPLIRTQHFTRYSGSLLIPSHPTLNVSHTLYYSLWYMRRVVVEG